MKKKNADVQAAPLAYVGPTIPGVATKGEVYTNGLPAALSAVAEQRPLIKKLIVELAEMPTAQKDIILQSGVYYAAFKAATE